MRVRVAKSYISSLELGYRAPHLNLLVKIAQALGVRPGVLVDSMVEEAEKSSL
jgi:transcriptional regulator with XRE-family HTH domain